MQVQGGRSAPQKLGEHLLEVIAAARDMQVLYVALSGLPDGVSISAPDLEDALPAGTGPPGIAAYRMPTGDLFLLAPEFTGDALRQLTGRLTARSPTEVGPDEIAGVCHVYQIPGDAVALRRLVRSYLAAGRDRGGPARPGAPAASAGGRPAGTAPAKGKAAPPAGPRGPLTLETLEQINALVDQVDIAPFIERQAIHRRRGGRWSIDYTEYFFDIESLRLSYFPKVDLAANESLFVEFTRSLDDLMLVQLLAERRSRRQRIGLNLAIGTIGSPTFKEFSNHLSDDERRNIVCELHWIDVLQDIQDGGYAVRQLKNAGYAVAMDRIAPPVLPHLNVAETRFDYLKIRFDRDAIAGVQQDVVLALRRCPADKVVLTACDDRRAVALGEKLGIAGYQGRLVDEMLSRAA